MSRPLGSKDLKPRTRTAEKRELDDRLNNSGLTLEDGIMQEWDEIQKLRDEISESTNPGGAVIMNIEGEKGNKDIIIFSRVDLVRKLNEFNKATLAYRASKMPAKKEIEHKGSLSLASAMKEEQLVIEPHYTDELLVDESGAILEHVRKPNEPIT